MAELAAVEGLEALIGDWAMDAKPPDGPPWPGEANTSFAWLGDRSWLIERWHVDMPEAPDGIAIIGPKDAPPSGEESAKSGELVQYYFDTRGVHRLYEMSLSGGVWKLWREGEPFSQRFTGNFSDDGRKIEGRWEINEDGEWRTDFDLTYRKVD
ncbi:MAG TPA: hypothetical protein VJ930_00485 [Acidimicrobiia bacterium]|nr:hypothetical protein [Acidimicrobiia bacterium]